MHAHSGRCRLGPAALVLLAVLMPGVALAQNAPGQGPLVVERVHNPFVIAPDYKVTDLDGEFGQLAGGYLGRSIEESLFIGGAGYWLVNGSGGDRLAYGGVLTGWSAPIGSRIRFGARGLVGFGRATLGTDLDVTRGFDVRGRGRDVREVTRFGSGARGGTQSSIIRVRARDDFFVFEPQADVLTRITDHVALNWAAGYRLTAMTDVLDDRLDGVTGSLALQLQW